jgi:hypothetical protein
LGNTDYWHDGFWTQMWTDRLLYFDDWLWYWQTEHVGEYDPLTEHAYPLDSSALDPEFLQIHGIGAVVVTGQAMDPARASPDLTRIRSGVYDVYLVNDLRTTVTAEDMLASVAIGDNSIDVSSLPAQGGTAVIRVNWFPRWSALVDGEETDIVHRDDGYMQVDVPPGASDLRLKYERTVFDWMMIGLCGLGIAGVIWLLIRMQPRPGTVIYDSGAV